MPQILKDRIARVREKLGITGKNWRERRMDSNVRKTVMSSYIEGYESTEEGIAELYRIALGQTTARESIDKMLKKRGLA